MRHIEGPTRLNTLASRSCCRFSSGYENTPFAKHWQCLMPVFTNGSRMPLRPPVPPARTVWISSALRDARAACGELLLLRPDISLLKKQATQVNILEGHQHGGKEDVTMSELKEMFSERTSNLQLLTQTYTKPPPFKPGLRTILIFTPQDWP